MSRSDHLDCSFGMTLTRSQRGWPNWVRTGVPVWPGRRKRLRQGIRTLRSTQGEYATAI